MLLSNLNLLATAPGGVARLRELILTLAVQGKLVAQDAGDEPASELLKQIRAEKDRLIAAGKIKKDKPLVAIAEGEKPFELPVGWKWVPLQHVGYTQTGTTPDKKNPQMYGGGIPFIKPGDIYPNRVEYENEALSQAGLTDSGRVAPAGSLLMVCIGTIGKSSLVNRACSFNQQINSITPLLCSPEYVNLYCRSLYFQGEAWARSSSTTIAILNKGKWEAIPLALPPLAEQLRIVTRVEELMRLCDALEAKGRLEAAQHAQLVTTLLGTLSQSDTPEQLTENWQRLATHFDLLLDRPQAVDALEQTILQLAVRGLLVPQDPMDEPASALLKKIRLEKDRLIAAGQIKRDKPLAAIAEDEQPFEVPVGWEWVPMGDTVNSSEAGWSPTCIGSPRRTGHWGVLKVSAVSWGTFDANANKELPADLAPRPQYEVQDGDFLLSRANTETLVARSVVVGKTESHLMLSDKIIRLDVSSLMNREFLNLCNNADHARSHYVANASGTSSSMKNVSREVVLKAPIPLPPLAEQSRIVTRVAQLRHLCADLRQRLAASQSTQAQLAEALVENAA